VETLHSDGRVMSVGLSPITTGLAQVAVTRHPPLVEVGAGAMTCRDWGQNEVCPEGSVSQLFSRQPRMAQMSVL